MIPSFFAALSRARIAWALVACVVASTVGSAGAATIDVVGPDGATVHVDGQDRGRLPFSSPVRVDTGVRIVEIRSPGYVVHEEAVRIDTPEDAVVLEVDLTRLSRWQAVGSSVALAGLGQLYQRRPVSGWTMMAVQVGAWLGLAAFEAEYQSARDDHQEALVEYESAITAADIRVAREQVQSTFDDVESQNDLRNYALIAVVAIGAYSVFDAWRAHDGFFAGPAIDEPAMASSSAMGLPTVRAGWRWSF